jgi:hypothetical protein
MRFTSKTAAAAGRKGGASTFARYGRSHMQAIGKAGFAAFAKRLGYMGGSRLGAIQRLQRLKRFPPARTPDQAAADQQWFEETMERLLASEEGPS